MYYPNLQKFISNSKAVLAKGPIALIFVEDEIEIDSTITHHLNAGFDKLIVFISDAFKMDLPEELDDTIHRVALEMSTGIKSCEVINKIIKITPRNVWMYYCYNAEYLFFPFSESRTVGEMLTFHSEERRRGMLTYVVDAYANNLTKYPSGVSLKNAYIDRVGYYALARPDLENHNYPKERQLNLYGGLHWRFEEYVPEDRQKIDRVALFRVQPGLQLRADDTFNDEEYNTYSCPWHHNLTAAIVSFRTAKALRANPRSSREVRSFMWHNSVKFKWQAAQLMDQGLMEPGQWF